MIRHIIVLLDDLAAAPSIPPAVLGLARLANIGVTVGQTGSTSSAMADEAAARQRLAAVARQFEAAGIAVDTEIGRGQTVAQPLQAASGFDLIAIIPHDGADRSQAFRGAAAGPANGGAPVILVPARATALPNDWPRRILVPLDGSPAAEQALPLAGWLAQRAGATLILLRGTDRGRPAVPSRYLEETVAAVTQQSTRSAADYLSRIAVQRPPMEVAVQIDVRHEPPAEAILAATTAGRMDLIVMVTRRRDGWGRRWPGSVASQVLRAAPIPVLLIPTQVGTEPTGLIPGHDERGTASAPLPKRTTRVRQIMAPPPPTVREDATLEEIARLMLAHDIGCVPVVDAHGRLRGSVTAADVAGAERSVPFFVRHLPDPAGAWAPGEEIEAIFARGRRVRARDIVTGEIVAATSEEAVATVLQRMLQRRVNCLPVVHEGAPVGLVTHRDMLRLLMGAEPAE